MRKRSDLRRLVFCGAALALMLSLLGCGSADFDGLEIHILDVDQGDAALIRMGEQTLMIDAGANATEESLCATLDAMGIERINTVIFTHPDEDHIGGGDLLLERFPVDAIYLSPYRSDEPCFTALVESAAASGAEINIARAGDTFPLGDAAVTILAPTAAQTDANRASIVARIDYGRTAALFMGDADTTVEEALLADPDLLPADLLKIGHHGADSSTSDALLDAVDPTHAAISCGHANIHGHPTHRVITALASRNITISRTDRDDTILYRSDGERLWREP